MVKKVKKTTESKLVSKQSQKQTVNIHIGDKGKKSSVSRRSQSKKSEQQISHYQSGFTPVYIQTGNPNDFSPLVQSISELQNTVRSQPIQPAIQPVSVKQPVASKATSSSSQTEPSKQDILVKDLVELKNRPKAYDRTKNTEFLNKLNDKKDKFEDSNPLFNTPQKAESVSPLFKTPQKAESTSPTPLVLVAETPKKAEVVSSPPFPPKLLNKMLSGSIHNPYTPRGNLNRYMNDRENNRNNLRNEFLQLGGSSEDLEPIKNNQAKLKKAINDMKKKKL